MADRQGFIKKGPEQRQIVSKYWRVAAVDIRWQRHPGEAIFKKMVRMFAAELYGVPEKGNMLESKGPGCDQSNKQEIGQVSAQN